MKSDVVSNQNSSSALLTKAQVADRLQVSFTTVWRYMNDKETPLPHIKIGRKVRFKESDLQAFIAAHAVQE